MKVMCIDGNWYKGLVPTFKGPKENEVVTVIDSVTCCGVPCYGLLEYTSPEYWEQENFIPLSNIDEMELLEQRESQLQSL